MKTSKWMEFRASRGRAWVLSLSFGAAGAFGCEQSNDAPTTVVDGTPLTQPTAEGRTLQAPEELRDPEISSAVDRELRLDGSVGPNHIMVTTTEGIVELTGTVNNLLAKERAALLAESVKGVRSVSNRIIVKPLREYEPAQLKNQIESALIYDPVTEAFELDVQVGEGGQVTLRGTVDSWQELKFAERVVKGVSGVSDVKNAIDVNYEKERSDPELETEIKRRLRWDTLVDEGLLDVSVKNDEVTLSGYVGSAAERNRAYSDAWVHGVKNVNIENVEVRWWMRDDMRAENRTLSENDIRDAIEDAMLYDPRLAGFKVTPNVVAGVVTLTGTVRSERARRAAEQIARNTAGVFSVDNELEVGPSTRSDSDIETSIEAALALNPIVESYELEVSVDQGAVTLSGDVDHFAEKAEAADIASTMAGVTRVENNLKVTEDSLAFVDEPYIYPYRPYVGIQPLVPPLARSSDQMIEQRIESELYWSPFVDRDDVNVSVEGGHVTLTGKVDSFGEYLAATDNAFEGGAVSVKNDLDWKSE